MNPQHPSYWDKQYQEGQDYPAINPFLLRRMLDAARSKGRLVRKRGLDLGCGTGDLARQLSTLGFDMTAVDFSGAAIEKAKAESKEYGNIKYLVDDVETFKPEGPYDLITMKLVLAFLKDKRHMLHRMRRMLTTTGVCILVAPIMVEGETYNEHLTSISDHQVVLEKWLREAFLVVKPFSEQYFGPNGIAAHYLLY